jgi:hypothetical protein
MLKALVEKIELRFDRKNPSPIEKIKVLLEALYQEYETDFPIAADPFRYQRTQTRFNSSHQLSSHVVDAVQRCINARLKIFKGGLNSRKDFLRHECSRFMKLFAGTLKSIANIHPINKVIRLET